MISTICIFCGSSSGNSPVFAEAASSLASLMADREFDMVYGGSNIGLMGLVASTMLERGRSVTGIIPRALFEVVEHLEVTDLKVVETMHERKAAMYERSDAFIALPGGIGTFEELLEVYTWGQLGYLEKPVSILNVEGYYDHLIMQLRHSVGSGFMKQHHLDSLIIESDPSSLLDRLESSTYTFQPKWQ